MVPNVSPDIPISLECHTCVCIHYSYAAVVWWQGRRRRRARWQANEELPYPPSPLAKPPRTLRSCAAFRIGSVSPPTLPIGERLTSRFSKTITTRLGPVETAEPIWTLAPSLGNESTHYGGTPLRPTIQWHHHKSTTGSASYVPVEEEPICMRVEPGYISMRAAHLYLRASSGRTAHKSSSVASPSPSWRKPFGADEEAALSRMHQPWPPPHFSRSSR